MREEMAMRATRTILVVAAVVIGVFAATYVSAQNVASLAGKWSGYASPTRGSNVPLEVEIKPDGTYTSKWGSSMGKGTVKMEGSKLMAQGQIVNGTTAVVAGTGTSELTLTSKDGKQIISGTGRDADGPFNFQLTKK
jgi:hypothetical protein